MFTPWKRFYFLMIFLVFLFSSSAVFLNFDASNNSLYHIELPMIHRTLLLPNKRLEDNKPLIKIEESAYNPKETKQFHDFVFQQELIYQYLFNPADNTYIKLQDVTNQYSGKEITYELIDDDVIIIKEE
jgi:hypothetical protein